MLHACSHCSFCRRKQGPLMMCCRRGLSAVWLLMLAVLCVSAVSDEKRMQVFFVHQFNFTLEPTYELQIVRSRLECVAKCRLISSCSLALHGDQSSQQRVCLHVKGVLTLNIGTVLMQSNTVMSPGVWAVVPMQPESIEWGMPNDTTPKIRLRDDK